MTIPRVPLAERMARYTSKTEGCWLWTGALSGAYGYIRADAPSRNSFFAHRVAYEMAYGPLSPGEVVDHRCHVPACVRPSHLRAVTNKQNTEHVTGPRRNNTSGYLGVFKASASTWRGKVKHHNKPYFTPTFATPEEADVAVRALRLSLFSHNDMDRKSA